MELAMNCLPEATTPHCKSDRLRSWLALPENLSLNKDNGLTAEGKAGILLLS